MFKSSIGSTEQVARIIALLKQTNPNLQDYKQFEWYWLFLSTDEERKGFVKLVGFDAFEDTKFSRPKYDMLIKMPHFNSTNTDHEIVLNSLSSTTKRVMHELHGRLLEAQTLRCVDIAATSVMTRRLFKYIARLGLTHVEQLVELYKAGGYGQQLKEDAEFFLSSGIVDEVCDTSERIVFGSNIEHICDLVDKTKWKYIKIATFLRLPEDVANKLERSVKAKYTGDLHECIDNMAEAEDLTESETAFLHDYVLHGIDIREKYEDITVLRCSTLIRTLNVKYVK